MDFLIFIVVFYGYIQEIAVVILPITTVLTIITFGMQLYTYCKNKSREKLNEHIDVQGDAVLNLFPEEYKPLLNNQEDVRKIDQNGQKGSQQDELANRQQMVIHINPQQEQNKQIEKQNGDKLIEIIQNDKELDEKLQHFRKDFDEKLKTQKNEVEEKIQNQNLDIDEKISKQMIDAKAQIQNIDEKLKNIDKLRDCKSMYDQIENIKISIKKYETKYEENFEAFKNNFMALYQNNQENQKKVRDTLIQLYEQTNKKRQVENQYKYYVRQVQDKSDLKRNYSLTVQSAGDIAQYCNAFREVRGDGNCFYTAFGYQFLHILLFHYSFEQFLKFIEMIKKIELPMKILTEQQDANIDDKEIEKLMLQEFLFRLIKLKSITDIPTRSETFLKQFAAYEYESDEVDSCLYGLSTIFFRNYSNYVIENSEIKDAIDDKINLLRWEMECNNNELVISELAKSLDIFVQLLFFENKVFQNREYGNRDKQKIILLIKPGHYNIGLLLEETQSDKLIKKSNALKNESYAIINQSKEYLENYQQYIQESSSLQVIVTNLLDQLQKGQLSEIEVRKLKEGLSENQY
ncbi:unnamed protein product (macronuclear) [Paramecium tetraurelia]|uniref:ubiquitinyl hydrolase 1 n=1 Tax=Paramecium tetraurelia TaxID=5888 RepID=A0CE99_PARTE|nr:uncharacterized protein GSPATT00037552001 [Paramecium tetraurelia]CAK69116.1 unnamed protein product [Paramecium tetraurelia]|eukprot:XP_001436513.1 hypothetical protein (macronuclear) [Paramecium tetraurelia strain d4-2]